MQFVETSITPSGAFLSLWFFLTILGNLTVCIELYRAIGKANFSSIYYLELCNFFVEFQNILHFYMSTKHYNEN